MNCWICGKLATTGEHKIKKSLFTEIYGDGPYLKDDSMFHAKEGNVRKIQGPNSGLIKYPNSLCSNCNNTMTQPFDLAYDIFFRYILTNESAILGVRMIDFKEIYGDDYQLNQLNLFKYFVKLLGCDISNAGFTVPQELKELLSVTSFQAKLKLSLSIDTDKALIPSASSRTLGIGTLTTSQKNLIQKNDPCYRWHIYFSFLHVWFWYGVDQDGPYGSEWIGNKRFLYLGTQKSSDDDQRSIYR